VDLGPISFILLLPFTFTRIIYILAYYYLLPLDTLNPLFIENLIISWGKVLGCVVCRFHIAAGEKLHADKYSSGAVVWSVAKLASITFGSLAFSYWFDKPWFHN
jgi:hypothetical protein